MSSPPIAETSAATDGSSSPNDVAINYQMMHTIGEDFYNSLEFRVDEDYDIATRSCTTMDSSSSSDTPDLFLRDDPVERIDQIMTMPSKSSRRSFFSGDSLLVSERSNGTKDSSIPPRGDSSSRGDILLLSERSGGYTSGSNRDTSSGHDALMLSERSNYAPRDASEGYDSLLISETTDETWRKMTPFPEDDDASSLSSTPASPFAHLSEEEDEDYGSSPSPGATPHSAHDADTAKVCQRPLSQRVVDAIDSPPLLDFVPSNDKATPDSVDRDDDVSNDDSNHYDGVDYGSDGESQSQQKQETEPVVGEEIKEVSFREGSKSEESESRSQQKQETEPVVGGETKEVSFREGSKSERSTANTTASPQDFDRAGHIPRRWIYDRVDGIVKFSSKGEEEEEDLPQWRRRPPSFLCLPSPLLGVSPWWFEENFFCTTVGKWGFFGGDNASRMSNGATKKTTLEADEEQNLATTANNTETTANLEMINGFRRMLVIGNAMLLNVCGLFAIIISGLALTRSSPSLLKALPFAKTAVVPTLSSTGYSSPSTDFGDSGDIVRLYLGLLAIGIDNENSSDEGLVIVGFGNFCDTAGMEQFLVPEDCNRCSQVGVWMVIGYFMAALAYVPIFTTEISRLYKDYDSNCSKVAASLWSIMSLTGYFLVLSCFRTSCLGSFYEGEVLYTSRGEIYGGDENDSLQQQIVRANFEWKIGAGQILFLIGLILKIIDLACNCLVATPAITRSRELQWDYEEARASEIVGDVSGNPQEGPPTVERTPSTNALLEKGWHRC